MPICNKCGDSFPNRITIENKTRVVSNRKYCLKCSPWGCHNTKKLCEGSVGICRNCGKEFEYSRTKGHRRSQCNSCLTHLCQRRKKEKAVAFFGGKCTKCGYDKCLDALDFHHVGDKMESASYVIMRWSWERAKQELNKCILVCCRCHREIHEDLNKMKLWQNGYAPDS